jgi:hypothetical protein
MGSKGGPPPTFDPKIYKLRDRISLMTSVATFGAEECRRSYQAERDVVSGSLAVGDVGAERCGKDGVVDDTTSRAMQSFLAAIVSCQHYR